MPKYCVVCGNTNKYNYHHYCSEECLQHSDNTCVICEKKINPKQKTCSHSCTAILGRQMLGSKPRYSKKRNDKGEFLCHGCNKYLLPDFFDKCSNHTTSGIQSRCRECQKEQRIKWHSKPESHLLELVRKARKRNKGFDLPMDWARHQFTLQKGMCYYTGIPMTHGQGTGRVWTNVSIDRMDSDKGYSTDNCVLCCIGFNLMKSNLPLDGIEELSRNFISRVDKGLIKI